MKKTYKKFVTVCVIGFGTLFMLSGCGEKEIKEDFTGSWIASQNTLNGTIYTGNIILNVEENGKFILSYELGDVSMQGELVLVDKETLEINCEPEGFEPPLCWDSAETDSYSYDFITEDVVVIGYNGNKIAFYRDVENVTVDELKNDNWLTNNGLDEQEITYRVEMSDSEINFYILDGDQMARVLYGRNLKYDSEKNKLSFVPDISVGFEPPYLWYGDMGKEIQEIILDVEIQDDYLILTYNDIPMKFYNDLMYQMDTESDIYNLFENSWIFESENQIYEMVFSFGDTVFVSCQDETGTECFSGMALIDETSKTMKFYIEFQEQNPKLWGGIANEMNLDYEMTEDWLSIKYNGNTIEFKKKP